MSRRRQLLCTWCGPATVVVALTGRLIAGILPLPLGSSSTTEEVVGFYSSGTQVVFGLVVSGICLVMPLIGLIAYYMLHIEGRYPLLTFIQLVTGAVTLDSASRAVNADDGQRVSARSEFLTDRDAQRHFVARLSHPDRAVHHPEHRDAYPRPAEPTVSVVRARIDGQCDECGASELRAYRIPIRGIRRRQPAPNR